MKRKKRKYSIKKTRKKNKILKQCLLKGKILGEKFESKDSSFDYNTYTVEDIIRSGKSNHTYLVLENNQIRSLSNSLYDKLIE